MYKQSHYNFFVPYQERVIYFNTLSESCFTLSCEEHERMQRQLADPISFELGFPSVFRQFKNFGFIVDKEEEEFDRLRFRYQEQVFNNRNYHLTLVGGWENDLDLYLPPPSIVRKCSTTESLELVKRHIRHMVETERIDSLCLEFAAGEPLLNFTEWIEPICQYAKQVCQKHHIDFHGQVATNGLLLPKVAERLESSGIKNVKITFEDSEAKHNKIRHYKGKGTFRTICENINRLCKEFPAMRVELEILYNGESTGAALQHLLDCFPASIRDNITLDFCFQEEVQPQKESAGKHETLLCSLKTQGFATLLSPGKGRWIKRSGTRFYQRTLLFNGNLYWDYPISSHQVLGRIDEKTGKTIPDETGYIRTAGLYWFENKTCRACKLLPLLFEQCAKQGSGTGKQAMDSLCPMNNPELTPEWWIVKSFEAKNTLAAIGKEK